MLGHVNNIPHNENFWLEYLEIDSHNVTDCVREFQNNALLDTQQIT